MARKLEVEVVGNTKDFDKAMDRASKKTDGFGSKLGGLAKGGAVGAAVGGLALLGKTLIDSVAAAQEANKAEARFADAMDKVGASAKQREAVQASISKLSKQAALDDEDLSDVYSKLVRTTGDVAKAQEAMALSADIARARNITLEQASKSVEKAYNGNAGALKKLGIEVEKGATGTEILAAAQKKFGGAAEAYGKTAAGAQEKFGIAVENLQEKIGQKLVPILATLATKATEVIGWLEAHGEDISKGFDTAWKVIEPIFNQMKALFLNLVENVKAMIQIVKGIMEGDWAKVWDGVKTIVGNVLENIKILLSGAPAILGKLALDLGIKLKDKIMEGIEALPGLLVALVKAIPGALLAIGEGYFNVVTTIGKWVLDKYLDGVKALGGLVVGLVKAVPGALLAIGEAYFNIVKTIGTWIVTKIVDGLSGLAGKMKDAVVGAVSGVLGVIQTIIDKIQWALSLFSKLPGTDNTVGDLPAPPGRMGGRAAGGPVSAGTPYIVGERGPELFMPGRSGTIIPNGAGGGDLHATFVFQADGETLWQINKKYALRDLARNGTLGFA